MNLIQLNYLKHFSSISLDSSNLIEFVTGNSVKVAGSELKVLLKNKQMLLCIYLNFAQPATSENTFWGDVCFTPFRAK